MQQLAFCSQGEERNDSASVLITCINLAAKMTELDGQQISAQEGLEEVKEGRRGEETREEVSGTEEKES
eukprot:762875-Hanusia_phi.AAC.2